MATNVKEKQKIKFVCPKPSDYIQCAMKEHDIFNCSAMKRIIHFLQIYEEQQNMNQSISIYDYMQLNGYDISQFLEDWYQVKMNHLNDEKDFDFLKDIVNNDCDGSNNCKYVQRYSRDREKDNFESKTDDFDVRNFILMDQMDSIHAFLFHSMQRRRAFVPFGDIDDDEKKQQIILPQSLSEFTVDNVIYVVDKHIFDNLKHKKKEKLKKHKEKILDYIKENKLNGTELCKMKRIQFINLIKVHLNDDILTGAISAFHKELMAYQQDVVLPQSLSEFSVDHIIHILKVHIFDKLKPNIKEKIQKHKEQILDYIKENKLNGNKLCKMKRGQFINLLRVHLNDKKTRGALGTLYKELMAYKQTNENANGSIISSKSKFITEEKTENNNVDENNQLVLSSTSKFITEDYSKNKEYYSFGEKYLYNPKLSENALFVKAKYDDLKQELFEYLQRENESEDAKSLAQHQLEIINSMNEPLRPLLKEFVNEQPITSSNVLWNKDIETSRKQLKEAIAKLCEYAKDFGIGDWDQKSSDTAMESMDINKIQKVLAMNKENYIKQQQQKRVDIYITKCNVIMDMESVKTMKASKNKSNTDYEISKDKPISFNHVFALILYSNCTKFCTDFRSTYRRLKDESLADYKKRHSSYANMGKLLFECFLFYASTDSKVSVLYHGMNVELLFKNLECKFIAPTSTTSEVCVACNFGRQGVVMKLESAESNKFIKTVNMALFTCFDNESEHFIFDYKLRIIDLFIVRLGGWIGKRTMNRLLLLDLLSNNVFVDNEQFLKEKTQRGLVEILKCIANDTMSTFTEHEYVNAFIEALITQNNGIRFNKKNEQSLISELRSLFITPRRHISPFQIEYQNEDIVICKLSEKKEEETSTSPSNTKVVEQSLTWSNILNIISHHLDINWAEKLRQDLFDSDIDLTEVPTSPELNEYQRSITTDNEQWAYLKKVIAKYMKYTINYDLQARKSRDQIQTDNKASFEDVYSVHKAFFEENNKTKMFGDNESYNMVSYETLQIPPLYVINDDLFEIKDLIIQITDFINAIRYDCKGDKHFNFFIIPHQVEAVIDFNSVFNYTFKNKFLTEECKECTAYNSNYSNFIIDRRVKSNKIYATQSPVDDSLFVSYLLIFEFILSADNVLKCYLNYGINERMRFYPQFIVDILPKLFKKKDIFGIYRRDFKNSWSVDLYDPLFNETYKKITGYDHVAINYDREKTLFIDSAQRHVVTSDVKEKYYNESMCSFESDLNECEHIRYLVKVLKAIKVSKSGNVIHSANYSKISAAFDHLVRSHSLFEQEQLKKIQSYFAEKCGGVCEHGNECKNLNLYVLAQREAGIEKMDSLLAYLKNKEFEEWIIANEYESDCIRFDIECKQHSFIYQSLGDEYSFEIVCNHMTQQIDLFDHLLNMIHVYLLHSQQALALYRPKNLQNYRYGSKVIKEKYEGFAEVNLGKTVLEWLTFGEEATFETFKDEMINNPQSTVNEKQFESFEEECKVKEQNAALNTERYCLNELVAMKIYCDTNEYQGALRRAFWDVPNNKEYEQMKKNFYNWAMTLYEAFLYAAAPPMGYKKTSTAPVSLYHGLNQILIVTNDLPKYYGIVSTSKEENVANSFTRHQGLLWKINGSYTNRFNFIKGVDMQWISCHPNEAEFALFNQHIPIKSTTNFADDDNEKVDILIQHMIAFEKEITSKVKFCRLIGFNYQDAWFEKIIKHPLLKEDTAIKGLKVSDRLFKVFGVIATLDVAISNAKNKYRLQTKTILVNTIVKLEKWNKDNNERGCLQIHCDGVLTIDSGACINGNGCGLSHGFGPGRPNDFVSGAGFGTAGKGKGAGCIYGDETLNVLHYGSPDYYGGRGGGIIEIIANKIINRGKISCCGDWNSSGGSIKLVAKEIENYGYIEAMGSNYGGNGRIAIYYQDKFVNEGIIEPKPFIEKAFTYDKNADFTPISHETD